jgi:hypothetical protein
MTAMEREMRHTYYGLTIVATAAFLVGLLAGYLAWGM